MVSPRAGSAAPVASAAATALQQSLELYLALRRRGKTAEAVIFPGESHGFHTFKARQQYMRAVETFADKYIGGIR